jgi:putative addiction module component (TIGR02574 family)
MTYVINMNAAVDELLRQALRLDEKDRASLAGALIESLSGEAEPGAEHAWEAVIKRRVEELERGAVETIPWSEVRERLFRGYE